MALFVDQTRAGQPGSGTIPRPRWTIATSATSAWPSRASATSSTWRSAPPPTARVSQLELELQAEVDKYACCLLLAGRNPALRRRLYGDVRFADDLDADERDRYHAANTGADRYAAALERRYVQTDRSEALFTELRVFYRLALPEKLGRIAAL